MTKFRIDCDDVVELMTKLWVDGDDVAVELMMMLLLLLFNLSCYVVVVVSKAKE